MGTIFALDCSSNATNEWHWFPPWTQPAATSNMFNAWNFGPPTGAYTNPARNPQFLIKSAFPTLAPKWIWNEREIQKINPRPPTLILDGHDPAWPPGKNRTHIIGPPHQCTRGVGGNHRTRRHTRVHNRYPWIQISMRVHLFSWISTASQGHPMDIVNHKSYVVNHNQKP